MSASYDAEPRFKCPAVREGSSNLNHIRWGGGQGSPPTVYTHAREVALFWAGQGPKALSKSSLWNKAAKDLRRRVNVDKQWSYIAQEPKRQAAVQRLNLFFSNQTKKVGLKQPRRAPEETRALGPPATGLETTGRGRMTENFWPECPSGGRSSWTIGSQIEVPNWHIADSDMVEGHWRKLWSLVVVLVEVAPLKLLPSTLLHARDCRKPKVWRGQCGDLSRPNIRKCNKVAQSDKT
ncbi:hypothetical protein DFH06DRAFT_1289720 [Mycena polygramma]|nr:hypothetical protein DFH06DRAFT_1289720 [Mycena polygramma]